MKTEQQIREFIIKNLYYTEDNPIADEDSFLETGVVDSMGVMELVAFVQSEFGVEVSQQEIVVENFDSIRKLADFVRRKLPPKEPSVSTLAPARLSGTPSLVSQ
jgi:acyl carrier protein